MRATVSHERGRHRRRVRRAGPVLAAVGVTAVWLAGCGPTTSGSPTSEVSVLATTTILGDVTAQVAACAGLEVRTLMPVGADPHDFFPSSADVSDLVRADLVVANGLNLEEGLLATLEAARTDGATVLEIAPLVDPIPLSDGHGQDGETDPSGQKELEHGSLDPHVWLDVARMASAARLIGNRLAEITGDGALVACGAEVGAHLAAVDAEVREILDVVPAASRLVVADHAAFGYFADAYGFDVLGAVVPGGSTLAEPSSAEFAALADVIRETGVPAIFADTAHDSNLVAVLAAEVGRVDVVELYVGSLGPEGSGADSYAGMMLTNAERVARALTE